jgi:triosephosphate isomerase
MTSAKLVVGNWKMTGDVARVQMFAGQASGELSALDGRCEAAICVPHPLLHVAQSAWWCTPLRWGAQDCCAADDGRSTGDVSAGMLRTAGARFVIVGHSERRHGHGESDADVSAKARRALDNAITPIVCIGETAAERDDHRAEEVLRRQLQHLAATLGSGLGSIVLAYEPVWAIGTGRTASVGMIEDVHGFIEHVLRFHGARDARSVRRLYGGSVDPRNARAIMACPGVDGVLVGGASQRAADFLDICKAASGGTAGLAHGSEDG